MHDVDEGEEKEERGKEEKDDGAISENQANLAQG